MLRRIFAGLATLTLVGAGMVLLPTTPASGGGAPAITVDRLDDPIPFDGAGDCTGAPNDCSLRGALEGFANDVHQDGVTVDITVPAGTYPLQDEIRMFQANVNVHGAGVGSTIVTTDLTENLLVRHLELGPDGELEVILSDMTFRDGAQGGEGGSIRSRNGVPLTILRMHFVNNAVRGQGGAIFAGGNEASDTLIIEDSTFANNSATQQGGAVAVDDGESAIISNSTFTHNAAGFGGALSVGNVDDDSSGDAVLNHVTMSGNISAGAQGDAATAGGSIAVGTNGEVRLDGSILEASEEGTVSAPSVPSAAAVGDQSAECYISDGGVLESQGHNVVDDDSCGLTEDTDQEDTAAGAQALGDNGGPTFTMALLIDSPAVDAAGATCDVSDDQRGIARPQDGNGDATIACDSGAYERPAPEPPAAQPAQETPTFTG